MDYTELVKSLREEADYIGPNNYELPIMLYDHLSQAAAAIEELDKLLDGVSADNDSLCAKIEDLKKAVEREKAFAECWEEMAQDCKARFQKLVDAMPKWISDGGNMNHEQYSRFQRFLGVLEGYGMGLIPDADTGLFWDTIENLDALGEELRPKEETE